MPHRTLVILEFYETVVDSYILCIEIEITDKLKWQTIGILEIMSQETSNLWMRTKGGIRQRYSHRDCHE